jgi:hypothetical protein
VRAIVTRTIFRATLIGSFLDGALEGGFFGIYFCITHCDGAIIFCRRLAPMKLLINQSTLLYFSRTTVMPRDRCRWPCEQEV